MKIYKYFSSSIIELIFEKEGFCGVKCSTPKDYNDPYELFLGTDTSLSPEELATYREIIQEIPQYPTTCFSKSPIVSPMWAHYAENHSGFVLEFDADLIRKKLPNLKIKEIEYKSEPSPNIADFVKRSAATMKPRHAVFLQNLALKEAYFSKYSDWSYEQELRIVDENEYCQKILGNDILFIPLDCVSSIILGSKANEDHLRDSLAIAQKNNIYWYRMSIGKSLPVPYMIDSENSRFLFSNYTIKESIYSCEICLEPLLMEKPQCSWCAITEDHTQAAARANPLRMLDRYGHLEQYLSAFRDIGKGK